MSDDDLIKKIESDEQRLVFRQFDEDTAWELGSLLVRLAREHRLPVAIDIRRGQQQLFHAALPGATAENDSWIERKVRVVQRFDASSYLVGRRLAAKGQTLGAELGVDPALFAAHGGAFPVRVTGAGTIGVVTVSGLPQADDHALVVRALETLIS
ncbi:heme-degrading domain-containing protein [Actinoplanes missouriensis]|uniref:heme-degrading domain-containing protein n=1 Tax=Actinoplanes missouriensis TaxID=1866 RepID=UPI0033DE0AD1